MKKSQAGFTLIELVMVIVILGVLAAVAIPKFIDLRAEASTAAVASVAGSLSAAAATNFAARTANGSKGVAVANCTDVPSALQGAALPTGAGGTYSVTAGAIAPGDSATCTLTFKLPSGTEVTAPFTGIGIV